MKLTFTKKELEDFKKTGSCMALDCGPFFCSGCPISTYMAEESLEDIEQFIESHLEEENQNE